MTLAERWDGTAWSIQPTPNPGQSRSGAACTQATICMAVGHSINSAGRFVTLGERFLG